MAAKKGANLIKDTFKEVSQTIATGNFTFSLVKDNSFKNTEMNSVKVTKLTRNTLHSFLKLNGPEHYNAIILQMNITVSNNKVIEGLK